MQVSVKEPILCLQVTGQGREVLLCPVTRRIKVVHVDEVNGGSIKVIIVNSLHVGPEIIPVAHLNLLRSPGGKPFCL